MPAKPSPLPTPSKSAPCHYIPQRQAVNVEHPCVIRDIEKAMETLGGDKPITEFVQQGHAKKPIKLKFHPEDAFSQPITSVNRPTNNVLVKITVPKRTGRKRKRGSDEPFVRSMEEASEKEEKKEKKDATYLLRSLRDNKETYQIEAVAQVPTVHIFRAMPDFAYSTARSKLLDQMREKILPLQYPLLSGFQLESARDQTKTEIIPPPLLSTVAYPANYAYRQNPAVKAYLDPTTGSRRLYNTQAPTKVYTQQCQWDTPSSEMPTAVATDAPPLESEAHNFQGLVVILRTIFARRPIWTRRGLANQLPPNAPLFLAKNAVAYVAYAMRSGPWRDTYIRFGVDPRSDASYRKYQSLMIQLVSNKKSSVENERYEGSRLLYWRQDPDRTSHIFRGRGPVPADGKSWQLCDLEDPILKKLVEIPDLHIREQCENRYFGWYQNGTWCKLKVILKAKTDLLQEEGGADEDLDRQFDRFLALPESYNASITTATTIAATAEDPRQERHHPPSSSPSPTPYSSRYHEPTLWKAAGKEGDPLLGFLPRDAGKLELEWAAQYRALCRAPQGHLPPSGRLSKSKEVTRASYIATTYDPDGNEPDGDEPAGGDDDDPDGDELDQDDDGEDNDDDDDDAAAAVAVDSSTLD